MPPNPQLLENDEMRKFDMIMANPPYSVKRWNQQKWMNDPYGRNIWGTPPQGCADYAFQQHIMKSLNPDTGRSVVLWPHGVLFRDAESDIRKRMIKEDYVDAVIGLGKNLFYNSSMESCLLVCRMKKPKERKDKIIFIPQSAIGREELPEGLEEQGAIDHLKEKISPADFQDRTLSQIASRIFELFCQGRKIDASCSSAARCNCAQNYYLQN